MRARYCTTTSRRSRSLWLEDNLLPGESLLCPSPATTLSFSLMISIGLRGGDSSVSSPEYTQDAQRQATPVSPRFHSNREVHIGMVEGSQCIMCVRRKMSGRGPAPSSEFPRRNRGSLEYGSVESRSPVYGDHHLLLEQMAITAAGFRTMLYGKVTVNNIVIV